MQRSESRDVVRQPSEHENRRQLTRLVNRDFTICIILTALQDYLALKIESLLFSVQAIVHDVENRLLQ